MKRKFLIIFIIITVIGKLFAVIGDINQDEKINIVDALLVAQYYVGIDLPAFSFIDADVDCNGAVNIIDALLIAQYYVGLIAEFPCDTPSQSEYKINVSANIITTIYYSGDYSSSDTEFLPVEIGPHTEPFTLTITGVGYELHSMMLMYIFVDGQIAAHGWPNATVVVSTTEDSPVRNVEYFYANSNPSPVP